MTRASRQAIRWVESKSWAGALAVSGVRGAWRITRGALCSPATAGVRRRLIGETHCRILNPRDLDALLSFAARHSWVDCAYLERQLTTQWTQRGAAAGAFDKAGRLLGIGLLDEYRSVGLPIDGWWLRAISVRPVARGMKLGYGIVETLCDEAQRQKIPFTRAAIAPDNRQSLKLFRRCGFLPVAEEVAEEIRRVWRAHEPTQAWCILEREGSRARAAAPALASAAVRTG